MLLEGESLHIHSLETGDGLQVYQKNGYVIADYLRNGKKIATSTPLFTDVAEATPKSSTIYYVDEQKQLQQMNWLSNARQDLDSKDHILMPLFMQFSLNLMTYGFIFESSRHITFQSYRSCRRFRECF